MTLSGKPALDRFMFLPCAQPMEPAMKRLYVQVLLVVGVALVGANLMHHSPAPLGCRTELQA